MFGFACLNSLHLKVLLADKKMLRSQVRQLFGVILDCLVELNWVQKWVQLNFHTIFLVWLSLITKPIAPNCSIKFGGLTVQLVVTLHTSTSIIFFVFSMGATVFVQPLDLVKNRMQMSGEYNEMACYKNVRNDCFANVLV